MSGGFDTYGPSRHLYHALIEDLLSDGNEILLIESHSTGNDPDVPDSFLAFHSFSYITIKRKVVKKRAFVRRYLNELLYVKKCKRFLKKLKTKYDAVLIQSLVCAPFLIPAVKRITKTKVLWNIQDMFPGASIANGVLKNKFLQKFFYNLHLKAYSSADYITVISEDMFDKVVEQGFDKERIEVIYDWFDDTSVRLIPWDENIFVKKYNLNPDLFYVQFAGTMGFNFDYRMVLKIATELKNEKNIVFQMIGFGSQMDIFMSKAKTLGLDNVVFLPLQKQEMVSHVYSAASIGLIPLPFGVIGNSVPSKIGLLMACKKAVVTTADGKSKYIKMINDNKIGFGFSTDSAKDVARAIIQLRDDANLLKELGQNGYDYGKTIYSRSYNTQKYIKLFKKIFKEE